ncbi:unnamed protein product, partial [Ascophyllum nodosum]
DVNNLSRSTKYEEQCRPSHTHACVVSTQSTTVQPNRRVRLFRRQQVVNVCREIDTVRVKGRIETRILEFSRRCRLIKQSFRGSGGQKALTFLWCSFTCESFGRSRSTRRHLVVYNSSIMGLSII